MNKYRYSHTSRKLKFEFLKNSSLQTFSLRQTEGEHRIIYPPTSPSAHKVGKNVFWAQRKFSVNWITWF